LPLTCIDAIEYIYHNTDKGSPLRAVVLQYIAFHYATGPSEKEDNKAQWNGMISQLSEFAVELVEQSSQLIRSFEAEGAGFMRLFLKERRLRLEAQDGNRRGEREIAEQVMSSCVHITDLAGRYMVPVEFRVVEKWCEGKEL
jgi:hypothetical protein